MNDREYNEKAINDVYKNAHIALQSISDLIPKVKDGDIKEELRSEYEGYEKLVGEISSFMTENGIKPKDIGFFQKAVMWSSIKLKATIDNSRNQIAEMMLKGTVNGINELQAMVNEKDNLDENVAKHAEKLLSLEKKYQDNLRTYL